MRNDWLATLTVGLSIVGYQAVFGEQTGRDSSDGRRTCGEVTTSIKPGLLLANAVTAIARTCHVRIGFESADGQSETVALKAPLGLRMADPKTVLQALIGENGTYGLQERAGNLIVRPATRDGKPVRSFLDTTVRDWSMNDVTLRQALDRVIQIFSPIGLPTADRVPANFPRVAPSPQSQRVISLSVQESTVADLLTAIVAAHGEAGWQVTYRAFDANAGASNPSIGFFTFDGSGFGGGFPRPSGPQQ